MTAPDEPEADGVVVLGVDPGLVCTGYGAIRICGRKPRLVQAGVFRVPRADPLPQRLCALFDDLTGLIDELRPSVLAIEEVFSHVRYPKTAIVMGHARGVLLLAAARAGVEVAEYAPTRIKAAVTGHGGADKESVGRSVVHALSLSAMPSPSDVTDALAVALCHAGRMGR